MALSSLIERARLDFLHSNFIFLSTFRQRKRETLVNKPCHEACLQKLRLQNVSIDALATRFRIFLKTHLYHPFWVSVHTETAFSVTENEAFRKRPPPPEWIFWKRRFMLSCGRVKTELLENADVTVSIYNPSEHVLGSLGITQGHFVYLFSDFEYHSIFAWTGIISKTLLLWTRIFFIRMNKIRLVF